jgi:hypothetical protein
MKMQKRKKMQHAQEMTQLAVQMRLCNVCEVLLFEDLPIKSQHPHYLRVFA